MSAFTKSRSRVSEIAAGFKHSLFIDSLGQVRLAHLEVVICVRLILETDVDLRMWYTSCELSCHPPTSNPARWYLSSSLMHASHVACTADSALPIGVKALQVAVCESHSLVLAEKSNQAGRTCVYSFGSGRHGKLGHGNEDNLSIPTLILGLPGNHLALLFGWE